MRGEPPSAAEILEQIASDPSVLDELRALLLDAAPEGVPAYTVATLASAFGVTERVVRNAIGRGELAAVKRGARWLIPSDAVDAWAHGDGDVSRKTRRFAQSRQPLTSAFAQMGDALSGRRRIGGVVSVHRKGAKRVVRYREGDRNRSRSFSCKGDAERFDIDVSRRRELGALGSLDGGRETLDDFVTQTWAPTHGVTLAPKTRKNYALLYDHHIAPTLGSLQLRAIRVQTIQQWQAERLAAGAGPVAVRQALDLLGSVLQRAVEAERIAATRRGSSGALAFRAGRRSARWLLRRSSACVRLPSRATRRSSPLWPTPASDRARRSGSSGTTFATTPS